MPGRKWTEKEMEALKALAEKGYTVTEIFTSGVFNRSLNSIMSKAISMGLSLAGPQNDINEEAFLKMMEGK